MYRLIVFMVFFALLGNAQTKGKTSKKPAPEPIQDSASAMPVVSDTIDKKEAMIREQRKFAVYSKKVKTKTESRLKLCIQLISWDTIHTYCVNDSLCRDPETAKILFEETDGDTTYVLVYVDAFSKPADKPSCDAGHETKLFFTRWNPTTNKAIWKQRTISSCMKGITNMTRADLAAWDKSAPLVANFHRGGESFVEIKFDPAQYKKGIQTVSDTDSKPSGSRE